MAPLFFPILQYSSTPVTPNLFEPVSSNLQDDIPQIAMDIQITNNKEDAIMSSDTKEKDSKGIDRKSINNSKRKRSEPVIRPWVANHWVATIIKAYRTVIRAISAE